MFNFHWFIKGLKERRKYPKLQKYIIIKWIQRKIHENGIVWMKCEKIHASIGIL